MNVPSQPPLYRWLLRLAAGVLLSLLGTAAWLAWQTYEGELEAERNALAQAADARVQLIEGRLEQALQVLAFSAAHMSQAARRDSRDCANFVGELVRNEKGFLGAWALRGNGEPLCGALNGEPGHSAVPPLPALHAGDGRVWSLRRHSGRLLLRHEIPGAGGSAAASVVVELDPQIVAAVDAPLLDRQFRTSVKWFDAPRAMPARRPVASHQPLQSLPLSLRGRAVGELVLQAAPGLPDPGSGARGRLGYTLGMGAAGLALLAAALVAYSQRLLRRDVARLVQAAGDPQQAMALTERMRLPELAAVARAMAAEQSRLAALASELRRNAQHLEQVQRTAAIGSWRLHLRDGSIEWSGHTFELFGLTEGTPLTLQLLEGLVHPDDLAAFRRRSEALNSGELNLDTVYRIVRPDGRERVMHARGTVDVRGADGRPEQVFGTVQDITEAYGAARLNEALSGALFLTGDAVLLARTAPPGRLVRLWANPAYDAVHLGLGLAHAQAHEQLFQHERGLLREQAAQLEQALREQRPVRLEVELQLRQGRRWTELDLIPVMAPQGGEVHWLLVLRDISARHQAEQRVRDSERRYRLLFDHHPLPMWTYDTASLRIVEVNQAATRDYGYSREEFLQRTIFDLHAAEERDAARRYLEASGGRPPPGERRWRLQTASGQVRVVDLHGQDAPFDGPGHRLLCPVDRSAEQHAVDALRRLNTELEAAVQERTEALARREQLYRVLSDLSPQILWQTDAQGRVTYLNRAWYELVGPAEGDWLGSGWLDAVHPDDIEPTHTAFTEAAREGRPMRMHRRLRSRSGSYRSFLCVGAPVLRPDGTVESWVGVDTDITELERQSSRLRQLNDELESFSYSVSHDLRAPVQVMKGFLDAVLSGQAGQVDERARHYLERVLRNARRMDELISDMLALSRLSRSTLRCTRFDVAALARSVVETIQERYPAQVVECWTPAHFEMMGDRGLIQVALENLMDNAAKFSQGRTVCRLEFTARRERGQVVLELADEGVGFPPEYAHKLFRPFQRLHSQETFAGTGVGLATVARIIHLHGGEISGRNREGGGAVFELRLPLAPEGQSDVAVVEEDVA
ncbi:PAS domain S-box protein [Aquabacterium sp. A7-Y]|uniref:PAS domain S-box protein n=1 Tax=Aquabacterium sp. A7-Y TaxID=1349605 RepID=UPI00223CA213|nr:PAS domain S-box protein [Aquabacterium sp. A7-Y]MCW7536549.1 PAS domain S-box protein [Aquabacterium sp. A7-Y]